MRTARYERRALKSSPPLHTPAFFARNPFRRNLILHLKKKTCPAEEVKASLAKGFSNIRIENLV
jgi:hypothetical protein